ncbi:hypothetical protein R1sor_012830 [Riccia sorocarpa]|uniref:Uncharacterized protein n=1 Tax=Riccia sorocarpa TaxID=122646 RepID=A0ABD3I6S2_9MARC
MQTSPNTSVRLKCCHTGQWEILEQRDECGTVDVSESFLSIRFSLHIGFVFVSRQLRIENEEDATVSVPVDISKEGRFWKLLVGTTNIVYGLPGSKPYGSEHGEEVMQDGHDVTPTSNARDAPRQFTPATSEVAEDPYLGWAGVKRDPFLLYAFDAAMLITTDAGHSRKKMYEISQVSCIGSLRCSNLACTYKAKQGTPNVSDWTTGVLRDQKYSPGMFVPNDGHKCLHCGCRAFCVKACYAKMFFVLPSKGKNTSPSAEQALHMSRCVVHVGTHCHPPRSAAPRNLVHLVEEAVKEEVIWSKRQ